MGILSNLFKQKSAKSRPESSDERRTFAVSAFSRRTQDPGAPAGESADAQPSQETEAATQDTPQRNVAFGVFKKGAGAKAAAAGQEPLKNIAITSMPSPAPAVAVDIKSHTRSIVPVKNAAISDKQVAIDIDDVLPQIPPQLLKSDRGAGAKKPLLFNTYELLPGLSQGKTTMSVARIAELAPEFFNGQAPAADAQVELPLKKIAAQIGVFPGRPDQVEEIYPPLDARYEKLVLEKGGTAPAAPAAKQEPSAPAAAVIEMPPAAAAAPETPAPAAVVETPAPVEVVEAPAPVSKASPATGSEPVVEAPAPEEKAAVAAAGSNGHTEAPVETPQEIETVSYSLASIFPNVPKSWLDGNLKSVDGAVRITVPFDLVEVQLATGRVELPFEDFFRALPENLKGHFSGDKEEGRAAKVLIPLNEVFQNLPGVEPLPPPEPKSAPPGPEDVAETEQTAEVKEPEAEAASEPAAKAEPAAVEPEKPAPVVEEAKPVAAEVAAPAPEVVPEPVAPVTAEVAPLETPVAPVSAPVEAEKPVEAIQPPVVEPVIEPAPAKVEPAAEIAPVAVVAEPEPATPAPAPEPVATPEPPKVAVAPPPVTAYVEPPPAPVFITPRINVQRMAAPSLLPATASMPTIETPKPEPVEAKAQAPIEPSAASEPSPVPAPAEPAAPVAAGAPSPAPATGASLTNFIVTDGKLDTRKTVEHVILLPGIKAAALTIKGKTKTAGGMPESFHAHETGKALFQSLESHGSKAAPGAVRSITLHHEQFSATFFKQNGIQLCALHPQRHLDTTTHEALLIVIHEIVRLRQH